MTPDKPYVDYRFIGVKPFTALLDEAGVGFVLFDNAAVRHLHESKPDYFNAAEDTITVGKSTQEGAEVYFAEFGIKITPSFRSYVVFIYDHHPSDDEMLVSADDIETLVHKSLDGVNLENLRRMT